MKGDLGPKKVFKCDSCEAIFDRDGVGARNILIRDLTFQDTKFPGIQEAAALAAIQNCRESGTGDLAPEA